VKLVTEPNEISGLASTLSKETLISFDTEFIRENTFYPELELIQIGTENEVFIVDVQAFRNRSNGKRGRKNFPELEPLFEVFENPEILKLVHAAMGDQECLYTQFGVFATPALDTAIAASLCGFGDQIGLASLLKQCLGVTLKKGHSRTNWAQRPLPPELLQYAADDVRYLVRLGKKLIEELEQSGRKKWAMDLSSRFNDPQVIEPDFETIIEKVARSYHFDRVEYQALRNLVVWRETRVRELNLPRRWVADDQVLIDLCRARPKNIDSLSHFRGLNRAEIKNSGHHILEAIRSAEEKPAESTPKRERPDTPTAQEAHVLSLMKCFVGILTEKHQIIPRLLIEPSEWLPIIRANPKTRDDLKGLLSDYAIELIGDDLVSFLNGRSFLSIKDHKVSVGMYSPNSN
jgi:ribonuclease D